MSTLAHARGGLRPALLPEAPFHPGLQVHAIAAPRADRRLSLLISILCYESLAALVFLTVRHREAIRQQISTLPPIILTEFKEGRPLPPAPQLPSPPAAFAPRSSADATLPAARPLDIPPDMTPGVLPSVNRGDSMVGRPSDPGAVVGGTGESAGSHPSGRVGTGTALDMTADQVLVLHRAEPVYPAFARVLKIQGDVVVRMVIDTHGLPSDVKVVSGPEQLRAEALRCARLWRFTPARVGGEPAPAAFNLTLRFVLRG